MEAWSIDNPLRTWKFNGRAPDELEGLHDSDPKNYISIVSGGFRIDLRGSAVGQVYGAGESIWPNAQMFRWAIAEAVNICLFVVLLLVSSHRLHKTWIVVSFGCRAANTM